MNKSLEPLNSQNPENVCSWKLQIDLLLRPLHPFTKEEFLDQIQSRFVSLNHFFELCKQEQVSEETISRVKEFLVAGK